MKQNNTHILHKIEDFAWQTIALYEWLMQMQEARTSRAASGKGGQDHQNQEQLVSTVQFSAAYSNARKTYRWLRFLYDSGYISNPRVGPLLNDCGGLLRLIGNAPGALREHAKTGSAISRAVKRAQG